MEDEVSLAFLEYKKEEHWYRGGVYWYVVYDSITDDIYHQVCHNHLVGNSLVTNKEEFSSGKYAKMHYDKVSKYILTGEKI
jgi:hypothetical protein